MIGTRTLETDLLNEMREATFNTMTMPFVIDIIPVFTISPGPVYRFIATFSKAKLLC
jgi:hypothetical protein